MSVGSSGLTGAPEYEEGGRTRPNGAPCHGELRVTEDQKQEYLVAKAKEADEMAEKVSGALTREAWRKIAQNYRKLAGVADDADSR